jgi:D-alanine-D-alanine ligase
MAAMSPSPLGVAVLFGGPSPEHDVSILTGLQATRALMQSGAFREVRSIYWSKTAAFFGVEPMLEADAFADGPPKSAEPLQFVAGAEGGFMARKGRLASRLDALPIDAIVNCCHGGPGEDGALQGALDLAGLAYSGPSAASAALGMDKLASGEVIRGAGLPTLPRALLAVDTDALSFAGPFIVKPRFGGSSIGIDVVEDLATARARLGANVHLKHGAVIEPYRPDLFDLQIAVRTWPELALSAIERPLRKGLGGEILDYRDKYVGGEGMDAAAREIPAVITEDLAARIRAATKVASGVLGVRGVARIDFLSDGNELFLNEINTIPGSLSRHLFVDPPLPFNTLLSDLIVEATTSRAAQFSAAGADGSLLREAASISSKLG